MRDDDAGADDFRIDGHGAAVLERADVIFSFDANNDTIQIASSRSLSLRYDNSLDLDGDGNLDTVLFTSSGSAYVIIDDYVTTSATNIRIFANATPLRGFTEASFGTTSGGQSRSNILVGKNGEVDKFEIDIVTEIGVGNADIIHRFDKAGGDKIKLVATGGAPAFNGVIHFDSNADWNGDGTKDTILHVNGRALAIILGQSITNWAVDDFEDGTVTGVSELDFTALPDIS
ncbi:MAG: hypothetical protein EBR92_08495 [Alphaproteobacteria bacterium]|nr:hypothetical protein [Alphaproteobacteria bacterium]